MVNKKKASASAILGLFFPLLLSAAVPGPRVNYLDLTSGPNTGGEHGLGVYVRIFGQRFGALRIDSTVKFGGGEVANYVSWSANQIIVELGPAVVSGPVVVRVAGVDSNNSVTFTIRAGNIYFASPTGVDTANGSFATPWKTLKKCRQTIAAGDTCYGMDGLIQTGLDTFNATISISSSGTAAAPKAILGYPNAFVTVDGSQTQDTISTPSTNAAPFEYWVLGNLYVTGAVAMKLTGRGWRIVNNELQCPTGDGPSACFEGSKFINGKFLGNRVHNAGCGENPAISLSPCAWVSPSATITTVGTDITFSSFVSNLAKNDRIVYNGETRILQTLISAQHYTLNAPFSTNITAGTGWQYRDYSAQKTYHGVYFSTNSTNVEVGWNSITNSAACRGIQFHSSPFITASISTASNTSPIVLTFNTHPNLVTGERGLVSGVVGNSGALGTFFINFTSSTTGTLWQDKNMTIPTVGTGAGTGGSFKDGVQQFDLYVHDNYIENMACDGINFATVDPSLGTVIAYNNQLINVGRGASDNLGGWSDPPPGPASYTAMYNACITNVGPSGTGNSEWYNNTVYNAGSRGGNLAGAINSNCVAPGMITKNNIFLMTNGSPIYAAGSVGVTGDTNLFFTPGAPAGQANAILQDPQFVNAAIGDFRLVPGSPAINAGLNLAAFVPFDFVGVPRPTNPNLGAFENIIQNVPPVEPTNAIPAVK